MEEAINAIVIREGELAASAIRGVGTFVIVLRIPWNRLQPGR